MKNNVKGKSSSSRNSKGKSGMKAPYRNKNFGKGSKQDKREEEIADAAAAMSRSNPISLYTKFKQFATDAASIPFSRPLGMQYDLTFQTNSGQFPRVTDTVTDPGLMRILFAPTIGVSHDYTSPMNRASINFYSRLRSTQKAFGDYDHQDLTMMMLGIDSCIMYHSLGRRIYGLLTDMTPVNLYYPQALCEASGVQFTNLRKTIQDFRSFLNEFALQVEQFALPKNIALFDRHSWMCEGIYTDGESSRAQTYMFVPSGFWQYDNTVTTGSQLKWVQYIEPGTSAPITVEEFMAIGSNLINAISNDNDFANISGDLDAYYGSAGEYSLPYIEEKYQILPRYDKIVLSQIENAVQVGDWATGYTPVISQNPNVNQGAIIFEPQCDTGELKPVTPRMNMHIESPSPDAVIEASRLMATFEAGSNALKSCGTEIVHCLDVFVRNPLNSGMSWNVYSSKGTVQEMVASETLKDNIDLLRFIFHCAQFDWAPRVDFDIYDADNTTQPHAWLGSTWDVDNCVNVKEEYYGYINTACLYSLFNIETK